MAHKDENGTWRPDGECWTRDEINFVLQHSPLAVERGIVRLYKLQTSDEQQSHDTRHVNNVGFSQSAARGGTFYAKCVLNSTNLPGKRLYGRGLEIEGMEEGVEQENKRDALEIMKEFIGT